MSIPSTPRRGSQASITSVSSVGGSLDIHNRRGSALRTANQNAISSLLQPPIVRTGLIPHTHASAAAAGFKPPTIRDIPPVTLTNIPHVPPETFREYLTRIGPLFESFQRGKIEPDQSQSTSKSDRFAEGLDARLNGEGPPSPSLSRQSSASVISPIASPDSPRRRSSTTPWRRNRNEPTPLSTIPNVYFEEDFHLENPRTFDIVSERAEIVRPPPGTPTKEQRGTNGAILPPRKALATNAILQEKLSWYMDTVEVHLINNISTASSGFFAALGGLKELQTEAEESITKIQGLREDLRKLDQEVALGGLEVAAKRRRRANMQKLSQATAQVQQVVEHVKKADELVDAGDYDDAADQMERVGRLVCGRSGLEGVDDVIDLRPLKALQGLDTGLQELQYRIGAGFAQRFTSILMADLRHHVETVPQSDTLKRWSRQRGIPPTYMETNDTLRKDLLSALTGLQRAGHTAPATTAYREAVQKEMKSLIRKALPSSSDDDAESMISISTRGGKALSQQEKGSILARNLRALDDEDAEKLLIQIYTSVGEALRRVSTQTKVLLDVTSSMPTPDSLSKSQDDAPNGTSQRLSTYEDLSQALDLSSLLGQAVDTAQTQITKVLKVRNEQSTRLPKERFLRYFTLNRLFADECEAVSGRGGQALRGVINAQISGFVQVLGTAETERIAGLLDKDDWNAVDFSDERNNLLQVILKAVESDPQEWSQGPRPIWEEFQEMTANGAPVVAGATNGSVPATKAPAKPAFIDETRYILVASASALLPTITTFLSLTPVLPSLTPAIATALLEVLRTFNSRSCQLILGAGATRSAGLKNITTKHLALASQGLGFVMALVPYMRECVRRHLPSSATGGSTGPVSSVLAEFDKTKRLYQDHQSGIHDKLVEIMTGRSTAHVRSMSALSFTSKPGESDASGEDDGKVSPYMETLTKETLTLHRVLARHLSEVDVGIIMRRIAPEYQSQWTSAFGKIEVNGKAGETRLKRDAETFAKRLGAIDGFAEVGKEILAVVDAKIDGDEESEPAAINKDDEKNKVEVKEEKSEEKVENIESKEAEDVKA
ncbi:Hypothetical protein R9X50_00674800 [Acrodontium crateriforme]|uniref:Vacuolar protein sorting-associated protein 54 n=1 Tax=Acrodontium crateriforme TaxID=150365 RepID=A0AAQ3M9Q1_9PEZI|nr:Hypothetical protein R9X50_00674800 [Acrodontium crateriforme]